MTAPGSPATAATVTARVRLARAVYGVAAALVVLLVSLSGRYGPHRDELYFVAAGHHLAFGYPDQPPITPAIAGLLDQIGSGSLVVLRCVSALVMGAVVVLAAATARELGGARAAQILAAVVTATSAIVVALGHLLSTATIDTFFWALISWLAVRALTRDEPRTWLIVGVVAGVALENKTLVIALLGALGVGVALTPAVRHHLRSRWTWIGGAIAVALWLPNVVWQAAHDWPQLALADDIHAEYGALGERIAYVALQLAQVSPLAAPLWIYGVVRLLRNPRWERARPLGWAYVVLFLAFFVGGGKAYYLAGIMPALTAAGCVALTERWPPRRLVTAGVALVLVASIGWPVGLPVLPVRAFGATPYVVVGEDQAETIGWPRFAATVRAVVADTGAEVVLTGNYGEAGAAERYGVGAPVFSGQNGFGLWGPPPEGAGPVVVVGYDHPASYFEDCQPVARIDNGLDIDNEEQDGTVWLCRGPIGGWTAAWPSLRHLSA